MVWRDDMRGDDGRRAIQDDLDVDPGPSVIEIVLFVLLVAAILSTINLGFSEFGRYGVARRAIPSA